MMHSMLVVLLLLGTINLSSTMDARGSETKGLVVCSGGGDMFLETISMIEQTRYRMKSKLPIVVAHCNELEEDALSILSMIPQVTSMNLCKGGGGGTTGTNAFPSEEIKPRIKGFFCKPAALIMSPFKETMLVDSDVIWFKQPDTLFQADEYVTTGTLFFRDRWTQTRNPLTLTAAAHSGQLVNHQIKLLAEYLDKHYHGKTPKQKKRYNPFGGASGRHNNSGVSTPKVHNERKVIGMNVVSNGRRQALVQVRNVGRAEIENMQRHINPRPMPVNNPDVKIDQKKPDPPPDDTIRPVSRELSPEAMARGNAFWRHMAFGKDFTPDHWQDSSVVLFDSSRHPRMIALFKHMMKDFKLGYGDKEMYWIAGTAAHEPFAFEPHIVGSLGDCGAVVHFDPSVGHNSSRTAEPFYVNAEYLIDLKKIKAVGDFLGAKESLITSPMRMNEATTPLFKLEPWKKMDHGFYPCGACTQSKCSPASNTVVQEIKIRQKLILLLKKSTPEGTLKSGAYKILATEATGSGPGPGPYFSTIISVANSPFNT